jgi:hypothetical protein
LAPQARIYATQHAGRLLLGFLPSRPGALSPCLASGVAPDGSLQAQQLAAGLVPGPWDTVASPYATPPGWGARWRPPPAPPEAPLSADDPRAAPLADAGLAGAGPWPLGRPHAWAWAEGSAAVLLPPLRAGNGNNSSSNNPARLSLALCLSSSRSAAQLGIRGFDAVLAALAPPPGLGLRRRGRSLQADEGPGLGQGLLALRLRHSRGLASQEAGPPPGELDAPPSPAPPPAPTPPPSPPGRAVFRGSTVAVLLGSGGGGGGSVLLLPTAASAPGCRAACATVGRALGPGTEASVLVALTAWELLAVRAALLQQVGGWGRPLRTTWHLLGTCRDALPCRGLSLAYAAGPHVCPPCAGPQPLPRPDALARVEPVGAWLGSGVVATFVSRRPLTPPAVDPGWAQGVCSGPPETMLQPADGSLRATACWLPGWCACWE